MTITELHESYELARAAQDARYESTASATGGAAYGTPEHDAYYGQGEQGGHGTEVAVTWQAWLQAGARERRAEAEAAEAWAMPVEPADLDYLQPADLLPEAAAPAAPSVTTAPSAQTVTAAQAFRASGAQLRQWAAAGESAAAAEIARRAAKRATKRAA